MGGLVEDQVGPRGPLDVGLGDLDGDGLPDVVVTAEATDALAVAIPAATTNVAAEDTKKFR